jgi:arylsulfatase A-like enzyme
MTDRAIEFIDETGDTPWMLHLSYIKPHWPYIAPAPYHNMYGQNSFIPPHRSEAEKKNANPVFEAFMDMDVSQTFSRDEVRETVLVGYMGLIKQIDDHLGRLFETLEKSGRLDDTMIVFTSDHGDYMGDHWLGEKELFHEESVRVPLIIYDPSDAADKTRGHVEKRLVEAIDLVPTFLDVTGVEASRHWLEGQSLAPLLHGQQPENWREFAFSEIDYAFYSARKALDVGPSDARAYMIRTTKWKYIHFKGFAPMLFDLANDPDEFDDLGVSDEHADIRAEMKDMLLAKLIDRKNRVTMTDEQVIQSRDTEDEIGIIIGVW